MHRYIALIYLAHRLLALNLADVYSLGRADEPATAKRRLHGHSLQIDWLASQYMPKCAVVSTSEAHNCRVWHRVLLHVDVLRCE